MLFLKIRFAAGVERIANLLDEKDIESFLSQRKEIKVGLVPVLKNCPDDKKNEIKMKLFELSKKFEENYCFEFLQNEKKVEKMFEYLEKVDYRKIK